MQTSRAGALATQNNIVARAVEKIHKNSAKLKNA
jgi:hypothetical protein